MIKKIIGIGDIHIPNARGLDDIKDVELPLAKNTLSKASKLFVEYINKKK